MRLPFECPMDHVLNTPSWFENDLGVSVRESNFLNSSRVPASVSGSITKVKLPSKPHTDAQIRTALKQYEGAAILEFESVAGAFCGFEDSALDAKFKEESKKLLSYSRTPFCTMEGSNNAPLFSQCCSPRKPGDKFFPCLHGFEPPQPLPACTS